MLRRYAPRVARAVIEQLFDDLYWVEIDDGRSFQASSAEVRDLIEVEGVTPWRERLGEVDESAPGSGADWFLGD